MAWNAEYWDLMETLYWEPERLGCRPVIALCDKCAKKKPDPEKRGQKPVMDRLRRGEVPLNDIINFFFRIAPARLPGRLFGTAFGGEPIDEEFEFLGREIDDRYGFSGANITQQDVFLAGPTTLLMIELKLGSKSRLLQVAKYVLLALLEEKLSARRRRLLLLYLTPEKPFPEIWAEGFECPGDLRRSFRAYDPTRCGKRSLEAVFRAHAETYRDVAERLEFGFMTYQGLAEALRKELAGLDYARLGDQTLSRLIEGLEDELVRRGLAI